LFNLSAKSSDSSPDHSPQPLSEQHQQLVTKIQVLLATYLFCIVSLFTRHGTRSSILLNLLPSRPSKRASY
jgi:hypothetical protein